MNLPKIPFLRIFFYIVIIGFLAWIGGIFFNLAQETPLQSRFVSPPAPIAVTENPSTEPAQEPVFLEPAESLAHSAEHETPLKPTVNEPIVSVSGATTTAQNVAAAFVPTTRYGYPPLSFSIIHTAAVPAIVNIICLPQKDSNRGGVTGTGIIIDSGGIVLTNAHVAQYIALKDYPVTGALSCVLRTGSPARPAFNADVLYFPKTWAQEHGGEYDTEFAVGTGEHDWALLYITEASSAYTIGQLPTITPDARPLAALPNDELLIAGYPAGFLSSQTITKDLWMVSTIATIQQILTFTEHTPDVFSVGGTIVAQGGISGGPAINAWGRLVGIAVTTSEGETTDERDLRFLSLSHIDADVQRETGLALAQFIAGNPTERAKQFYEVHKDELIHLLTHKTP